MRGIGVMHSIVVASILLAAIAFRIQYIAPMYGDLRVIVHSVICIQQIFILLTTSAIYHQSLRHSSRLRTMFQMLDNIDRTLVQFNVKFDYRIFRWKCSIETFLLVAVVHIAFVMLCIHYDIRPMPAIVYELLARFYPILLINAALLTFVNVCSLIRSKFMALKTVLNQRQTDERCAQVSLIECNQIDSLKFYGKLRKIASAYEALFVIVDRVNEIFGLMNLASLALLAISLTCYLFLLVKIFMENSASIDAVCIELFGKIRSTQLQCACVCIAIEWMKWIQFTVSAIWMLVLLAYITIVCHLTVAEANGISVILHDAISECGMDDAMAIDVSAKC